MDMNELKRILFLLGLLALAGCGAQGSDGASGNGIAIKVMSAKSFNPGIEHGRIEAYRVTITGDGISPSITAEFEGDATEGVIDDVPTGEDRTVSVTAINPNDIGIRAGEAEGVKVGGGLTEVSVKLEAVPIFTNVATGNTIDNTRLVFKIFSDPQNPIVVEELGHAGVSPLIDASSNVSELYLDESTGMGRLAPLLMEPGKRRFVVRDIVTGRSHEVSVRIVDGTGARPAPMVSSTDIRAGASRCVAPMCAP